MASQARTRRTAVPTRRSGVRIDSLAAVLGRYAVYLALALVFLGPFVWMFFGSLRRESEIHGMMFPFSWHTIVPVEWSLQSYLDIYGISEEGRRGGLRF